MRNSLVLGLGIAILGLVAIMVVVMHEATQQLPTRRMSAGRTTEANQDGPSPLPGAAPVATSGPSSSDPINPPLAGPPPMPTAKSRGPVDSQAPAPAATPPAAPDARATNAAIPESLARVALSYVGIDPEAEEVWYTAINDPNLSANARQNLIEDLNEDGFADPRNPTRDELPLILNRLWLIEEVASEAMDEVNAAAFQEAYNDLVNMYMRLTQE